MNTVILYFITNGKKFYLDVNGYWTTDRNEAQHHWENQIEYIKRVNPLSHLHRMQYELV
jgi:hypothetical protein